MALTKPSVLAEWCSSNPNDPTSLQDAIIEPTAPEKASGFVRLEKPSRQTFNWLFNLVTLWVQYLEAITDDHKGNLENEIGTQNLPTDMDSADTVLTAGLESKYLDDDFLSGFRIVDVGVDVGGTTDVWVQVSIGSARVHNAIYTRDLTLRSNSFPVPGHANELKKIFTIDGVKQNYVAGDAAGCATTALSLLNNTWYNVFAVYDFATGQWDIMIDSFVSGLNISAMSTSYRFRRIASLYYINDTYGFRKVRQYGDYFAFRDLGDEPADPGKFLSITGDAVYSSQNIDMSSFFPANIDVLGHFGGTIQVSGTVGGGIYITSAEEADPTTGVHTILIGARSDLFFDAPKYEHFEKLRLFGLTKNIVVWESLQVGGSGSVNVAALGYYDLRGKDWGWANAGNVSYIRGF